MGKQVFSNDLMNFSSTIARALIENPGKRLEDGEIERLLLYDPKHKPYVPHIRP
jgi:adenine-specific DNA-methyltransferase